MLTFAAAARGHPSLAAIPAIAEIGLLVRALDFMEPRTLSYFADAAAGECSGGSTDVRVRRVCTDSRQVQAGDLYVAIKGDKFDGHRFVTDAIRSGAVAAVVGQGFEVQNCDPSFGWIRVPDTRAALGRMAARYRQDFQLPMIAVAGSNGKTSTKELLAAVLGQQFEVLASEASFNNDIGVPLTLLRLEAKHRAAVVEIGTNHPGELAPLIRQIDPNLGVITSIGREHLEYFGDLDGVIAEEGVLAEMLPPNGTLYLNGDSPGAELIAARTTATVVTAGHGEGNRWRISNVRCLDHGYDFTISGPRSAMNDRYELNLLGRPQISNALLAIAVAADLGLSHEEASAGLRRCRAPKMRLELSKLGNVRLLNDAYNANADSTRVAFETLAELPTERRRIAVLGDMAELGAHARGGHEEMGRLAAELNFDWLLTIGEEAAVTAEAAQAAGLRTAEAVKSLETLAEKLRDMLRDGDVLLLKASRAARLERLVELLQPVTRGDH